MTYYLIATFGEDMTACVGEYDNEDDAETQYDIEELCWADDGILFEVTKELPPINYSYEEVMMKVMK